MKKIISLFALLLSVWASVNAHDFEVNGIYYDIISSTDKTVEVTYKGGSYYNFSDEYTGSVVIPESVTYNGTTYSVTSIDYYAFYKCNGLTSVTIPNTVTSIGNEAFYYCSGLTSVTIPEGVTSISDSAFCGCSGLTSVTIPNSVTSIGNSAFGDCDGLTSVEFNAENCTIMSYNVSVFYNCSALSTVTIGDNVKTIPNNAFSYCSGMTSITIGNSVNSIGSNAFYNCSSLTSVTIPNAVTSIDPEAFYGCVGLTSITIGNCVTSINRDAFYKTGWYNNQSDGILYLDKYCLGYKGNQPTGALTLKDDTRLIADYAFDYCDGLTSVTIPNTVTSIGAYAFSDCEGLTSVTIPNSVTSIGYGAFFDCVSLKNVIIGKSVSHIGNSAFYGCYSIRSVTSLNPTPPMCGTDVFKKLKTEATKLTVPQESVSLYENAPTWMDFWNIIGKNMSGINDIPYNDENTPVEYYNLNGVRVENPEKGVYIKRVGNKTTKVVL